jgi:DNA invertase Pin-like site-specific DNA recombinase
MKIGYMRISKSDGSQTFDSQKDELVKFGVDPENIYEDMISGIRQVRPGLNAILKSVREGDTLVVVALDRLGRSVKNLLDILNTLNVKGVEFKVLKGIGKDLDTTTPQGRLMINMVATFCEYERELISERTKAGIAAARARGRLGGRPFKLTRAQIRVAQAGMKNRDTCVGELCIELGISPSCLYSYVGTTGVLTERGERALKLKRSNRI